jgi:hypothetical protein
MGEGEQSGVTEEMVGEVVCGGAAPAEPPQETTDERTRQASKEPRRRFIEDALEAAR